jgi:hypothetical protein
MPKTDAKKAEGTPGPSNAVLAEMEKANQALIQMAIQNPNIPRVYANGTAMAMTSTDIAIILSTGGHPTMVVDLAYSTAKGLAQDLTNLIKTYEAATGVSVKTLAEMQPSMLKLKANIDARKQ